MPAKLPNAGIEEGRYLHNQMADNVFFPGPGVGKYSPWFNRWLMPNQRLKLA
jgi:hypothetical protein